MGLNHSKLEDISHKDLECRGARASLPPLSAGLLQRDERLRALSKGMKAEKDRKKQRDMYKTYIVDLVAYTQAIRRDAAYLDAYVQYLRATRERCRKAYASFVYKLIATHVATGDDHEGMAKLRKTVPEVQFKWEIHRLTGAILAKLDPLA